MSGAGAGSSKAKLSAWAKLWSGGDVKWEKDEVLDVLHWVKQLISLVLGVAFGILPFTGLQAFILYAVSVLTGSMIFLRTVIQRGAGGLDASDDLGNPSELVFEGAPIAMALFLLSWILTYTAMHF